MAVSTAVQVAAKTGAEMQARHRTNNFLDRMNTELFQPAGLYAFIMKYKPDAEGSAGSGFGARSGLQSETVDLSTNQVIAKIHRSFSEDGESGKGFSAHMKGLRLASGTTRGALALPEAAPLIFPALDNAIARDGAEETFKDKAKDAQKFITDYLDRRAQAEYARSEPMGSGLAVPEERRTFKSKLADPSHPMYNGGLVGFVSGGALTPGLDRMKANKRDYEERRKEYWAEKREHKKERKVERREGKREREFMKYKRRLDEGRDLSWMKQRRLDAFQARRDQVVGREGSPGGIDGPAVDRSSGGHSDGYFDPGRQASSGEAVDRDLPTTPRSHGAAVAGARAEQPGHVKRLMRQDVFYLMIVNMPTEAELAEARMMMAR